jgi:CyaY protein
MALSESEFRSKGEAVLEELNRSLGKIADAHDVEILYQNGVLTIEVEEATPGKIVISPNTPVRQIWISAQSRSFKLDWTGAQFELAATGESLHTLAGRLVGEQLGIAPVIL